MRYPFRPIIPIQLCSQKNKLMKKTGLFIILSVSLLACEVKQETVYRDVPVLHASSIYQPDSVYFYAQKYGDSNKELAESYLKRSKEAEASDLEMAVYYCKRAITLNPVPENYKALSALLEKTGNYDEMYRSWVPLVEKRYIKDSLHPDGEYVYAFGNPDEASYLEYMVACMLAHGRLYSETVYDARELGLNVNSLKERFFSDKRMKIDMSTPEAKNTMLLFLSDEELASYNKLESTFKDMLSSIKDVAPVFEIDKDNVHEFRYNEFNGMEESDEMDGPTTSYLFVNYLKEKREHPDEWLRYNYNHVIDISDSVKAVIYAIDTSENACPVEMRHIYHRLVTYNRKAEIISSQVVALQSGERLTTLSYNMNKFTVTEYKRNWKKPYDKRDFDNYITGTEKLKESSYMILPDGRIRDAEPVTSAL